VSFNPLQERGLPLEQQFRSWRDLNVTPYDKDSVHPFGRCRGIVANGIEVESVMFSHSLARNTLDPEVSGSSLWSDASRRSNRRP
jgi:hypothetical protein